MRKTLTTLFLTLAITAMADNLEGFAYGNVDAPSGNEWQSPSKLSLNKEQPRAYMFSFTTPNDALKVLPYGSTYYQSLDGTWKFHWVPSPELRDSTFQNDGFDASAWDDIIVPGCWNVQGLQKDGTMKYGVPIYVNQPVIFFHEVREGDWKKGVMRTPPTQWTTYEYRNEVGSYLRTFTIPSNWKGRQVYINFDGVDSFFYLWINGHYVGFSKNSRNTARFNITPYLKKKGENSVAVEVYRNSDGSFLEAQDMFRLPGIFRSTYLTSSPELEIQDLAVRTEKIDGNNALVNVDIQIRNLAKKKEKYNINYEVYPVKLYTDDTEDCAVTLRRASSNAQLNISNARLWSAEAPHRYVLVATLTDKRGKIIDCTSTYFGIRTVEIRDTKAEDDEFGLAGRYFYVNNKPVKLKGVNRHETNPSVGHAITREQMEREVMLMKRGNINHVRLSHYSNDPYWYYLCDKYGLYLEDEANIESHEYYYGSESLSHPSEWRPAHIARNMEMVRAHINAPSIVIWSLGNEAGPGDNFVAAYKAIKEYDRSRPVQYERNNDIVDMGSNQYPSVSWVQQVAKGNAGVKYPYHISEYAHSMGNSLGNLIDYWEAMESTNFFCGAAIWDWVDQAIDTYTKDGQKYIGYGGDHGDWPNDGMFCMNGIMLPDLSPKPQYFEVKKVYQNVSVTLDDIIKEGDKEIVQLTIFNKNYFEPLDYDVIAKVLCGGAVVEETRLNINAPIEARKNLKCHVPLKARKPGEYFLNIEFRQKQDTPWAKAGYVQMNEQLPLGNTTNYMTLSGNGNALKIVRGGTETDVQGDNFHVSFDDTEGCIASLAYNGKQIITPGNGPKLDAFRAPVDNDNWARDQWFQNGLYNLKHRTTGNPVIVEEKDGSVSLIFTIVSQAPRAGQAIHRPGKAGEPIEQIREGREMTETDFHFTTTQRYTIYPDGSIAVASSIVSSDANISLPRLGYAMKLPKEYNQYTYYGRGPLNNYADRKTGSFVGLYMSSVQDQFVNFAKPQSMGNREDVRWCALTTPAGDGLEFIADQGGKMSTSALPWSALQMTLSSHPHELPESDGTYLHLDCQVTGLGGNSCGQGGPLEPDRVKGALHQMSFIIRPISKASEIIEAARVQTSIPCPVTIVRDRAGKMTINGDLKSKESQKIMYSVTPASNKRANKPKLYDGNAIDLRNGGTVQAWYEGEDAVKTTASYERIENVPIIVTYVSSEEGPGGDYASNLVDGDPTTIWHTMYSITVPKYPHWVDFDCAEIKTIKGFTYLPRQDGPNGNIKAYKLQLSMDGKNWSDTVAEGQFENNMKEKKVMLAKPQKARFIRFTALSSQNGADFASGAEFGVLAE